MGEHPRVGIHRWAPTGSHPWVGIHRWASFLMWPEVQLTLVLIDLLRSLKVSITNYFYLLIFIKLS